MLSMQTTAKPEHIPTRRNISQKTGAESRNPRSGRRMKLEKITYDNLKVGSEVRDLSSEPPIMGFITEIEEYGWSVREGNAYSFSYFFMVKNCDGSSIEFDLEELIVNPTLKIVVREKNDNDTA
jgi:hypothetical protein|tara:strand:+ start:902 stop:1273 length:372 start_codon:yes stop_codon:yes gene_type:complete